MIKTHMNRVIPGDLVFNAKMNNKNLAGLEA
jgi:hypothetical protein